MSVFVAVKVFNQLKRKEEAVPAAPAAPSEELLVLREIRDAVNKA